MATKSPVFPMPDEPLHLSDYGFHPQFHYFQVLEEAKTYKSAELNLHKPLSVDKIKNHSRRRWWKSALFFFKSRWRWGAHPSSTTPTQPHVLRPTSLSGPIYITDSLSGPPTTFRRSSSASDTPYLSLRELNMDTHRISSPIYLVT